MSYSIVKADLINNKADILNLMCRNLGMHSEEWFTWKYLACPYGVARCWLIKDDNSGNFVGTAALFPRKKSLNNKNFYIGIAGDFAIDRNFRSFGLALKLQKHILAVFEKEGFDFVYGTPNNLAEGVLLKSGYTEIGTFTRYAKLLRTESVLKKYIKLILVLKIASAVCDFLLNLVSRGKFINIADGDGIQVLAVSDRKTEGLFERIRNNFNLSSIKDSVFLRWRYQESLDKKYNILFIFSNKREIFGYLVYFERDKVYYIEDIFFTGSEKTLNYIFSAVIRIARKQRISSISLNFFGNSAVEKILLRFGFIPREPGHKIIVYSNNQQVKSQLLNKENWFFMNGDNDA